MWMGTKLFLLQESGEGRLGWKTSKPTSTEDTTHSQKYKDPKQDASSNPDLSEAAGAHRNLTKRHKLTNIKVKQKSISNGKQRWKN